MRVDTAPLPFPHMDECSLSFENNNGKWEPLVSRVLARDFSLKTSSMSNGCKPHSGDIKEITETWVELDFCYQIAKALNMGFIHPPDLKYVTFSSSATDIHKASGKELGGIIWGDRVASQTLSDLSTYLLNDSFIPAIPADVFCNLRKMLPISRVNHNEMTRILFGCFPRSVPPRSDRKMWDWFSDVTNRCAAIAGSSDPIHIARSVDWEGYQKDPAFLARVVSCDPAILVHKWPTVSHGQPLTYQILSDSSGLAAWLLSCYFKSMENDGHSKRSNSYNKDRLLWAAQRAFDKTDNRGEHVTDCRQIIEDHASSSYCSPEMTNHITSFLHEVDTYSE